MKVCSAHLFAGKKAVVIGGSGGIGSYISRKLASSGASLVVHGSRESEKFSNFIRELNTETAAVPLVCDFTPVLADFPDSLRHSALIKETASADIVCICCGPFLQKELAATAADEWDAVTRLNYTLPGILISAALPEMIRKKWGRFLLFGGTGTETVRGFATNAAYGGAKTAAMTLVKSVALSYASAGITANALLPGQMQSENLSAGQVASYAAKMPSGQLIDPDTVADAAFFLLTHEEINGALLRIDGGWMPDMFRHK